jgi:hypothetical protein
MPLKGREFTVIFGGFNGEGLKSESKEESQMKMISKRNLRFDPTGLARNIFSTLSVEFWPTKIYDSCIARITASVNSCVVAFPPTSRVV